MKNAATDGTTQRTTNGRQRKSARFRNVSRCGRVRLIELAAELQHRRSAGR